MSKNIWIDGPNGIGKTTAAKRLCEEIGYNYYHNSKPIINNRFIVLLRYYLFELTHTMCVIDRCWVSEWVHGNIERGHTVLTLNDCDRLTKFVRKRGSSLIVFCPNDIKATAERIANRNEDHPLQPTYTLLYVIARTYIVYCNINGIDISFVDYVSDFFDAMIKKCKEELHI